MENKFVQIIKKKWLRSIVLTILLVAIIIMAYFLVNYAVEKANFGDLDMTKEKIYSISQETKDKLGNIDTDVTISIYNMYESVKDFAYQYARLNDHIKVEEVENLTSKTDWKTTYGVSDDSSFMIISAGEKEQILNEYNFYTYDYTTYKQIDITEEAITNGILDIVTTVRPKIYFLTGHNLYSSSYFQYLQNSLTSEANEIGELDLMSAGKVPDDCKVLVITALKDDIKELEKDALIKYIKDGGDILLLLDPNLNNVKLTNFQKVLDEYGVSVSKGLILEGDTNKMVSGAPNFVVATMNNSSSITKNINMDMNLCLINSGKLEITDSDKLEDKNVTVETLATVSSKAFYRTDIKSSSQSKISSDEDASGATIAALMTKKIDDDKQSKLIVFANTAFATNTQIQVTSQHYMYALDFYNNEDILLNSVSYLTEREDNITIRKNVETVNYEVTEAQDRIVLGIIFAVPILIIVIGIVVWLTRRRKQ